MPDDSHVYMFFHIPKTGGSTLREHFRLHIRPKSLIRYFNKAHAESGTEYFDDPEIRKDWSECRVIAGHFVHRGLSQYTNNRPVRYVVMLRDPVSKVVSQYNWDCKAWADLGKPQPKDFESWMQGPARRNLQARVLLQKFHQMNITDIVSIPDDELFDMAADTLRDFWLVGNLENFESSMSPLFRVLGISGEITQKQKVAGVDFEKKLEKTDDVVRLIRETAKVDQRLYDTFCTARPAAKIKPARVRKPAGKSS